MDEIMRQQEMMMKKKHPEFGNKPQTPNKIKEGRTYFDSTQMDKKANKSAKNKDFG